MPNAQATVQEETMETEDGQVHAPADAEKMETEDGQVHAHANAKYSMQGLLIKL